MFRRTGSACRDDGKRERGKFFTGPEHGGADGIVSAEASGVRDDSVGTALKLPELEGWLVGHTEHHLDHREGGSPGRTPPRSPHGYALRIGGGGRTQPGQ